MAVTSPRLSGVPAAHPPVESIRGVFLWRRPKRWGSHFTATSLPGHLLHLIVRGRVRQSCNGRVYDLGPGDVIWYHENEWVEGEVLEAPWVFYSVNFLAPALPPPDYAERVMRPRNKRLRERFQLLYRAWQGIQGRSRDFLCHAHLLMLLASLHDTPGRKPAPVEEAQLWWDVEVKARAALDRPYRLASLAALSGRSPATISRACRAATGESPMRRIKQIRLSLARGLVIHSELRMNEIARRVGYERLHEFSRDFRLHFGISPSRERARRK